MNRAKIWYHKVKIYEGTSPVTRKEVSSDFFKSRFIIIRRMSDPLFSETMFPRFSQQGSKTFCLFPTDFASLWNITRNNVSTTTFPCLQAARPHYARGICYNPRSVWICVWRKLGQWDHVTIVTPLFSKISVFKFLQFEERFRHELVWTIGLSQKKSCVFKFRLFEKRFQKTLFSWRIRVEGRSSCVFKFLWTNVDRA